MHVTGVYGSKPRELNWLLMVLITMSWLTALGLRQDVRSETRESQSMRRPNVMLIVLDDLGYNDVSILNGNDMPTPTLASIARQGVTFTRHYAEATCSPSRVALLTGRFPQRSGFRAVGMHIPTEFPTIAEALRAAGYSTHMIGKWHVGRDLPSGWPSAHGFDTWFGFINQWQLADPQPGGNGKFRRPTYENPWLRLNGAPAVKHHGHLTDILTDQAVHEIEQMARTRKPWFLYLAYFAPHTPIEPAARFAKRFPATPEGRYRALVAQVDDGIDRVLSTLARSGDANNTLVIVLSDNGGTNRQRDNNFPFYGKKNGVYEGSYRTPMFMRWPGKLGAGQIVREPVMNLDVYPTVMGALGLPPPPHLDGADLMPSLLAGKPIPRRARTWETYLWNLESLSYSVLSEDGRWRLSGLFGLRPSLYDLDVNPAGATDVAAGHPEIVARLRSKFREQHNAARTVPVEARRTGDDTLYSGFDFLRTPYRYGFALGAEIGPFQGLGDAMKSYVVAEQKGVWQLTYSSAQGLRWIVGGIELDAPGIDPQQCNAVIMTAYFNEEHFISRRIPRNSARLYVNGALRRQKVIEAPPPIPAAAVHNPTVVHHRFDDGATARSERAVFINIALSSREDGYEPVVGDRAMRDRFVAAFHDGELMIPEIGLLTRQLCH